MENKEVISQEMIDLVIARLEAMPQNLSFSIGDKGDFNVSDLMNRVRNQDDIGRKIVEMQLTYLRSLGNLPVNQDAIINNSS
jgi:hypothetical protein